MKGWTPQNVNVQNGARRMAALHVIHSDEYLRYIQTCRVHTGTVLEHLKLRCGLLLWEPTWLVPTDNSLQDDTHNG